MRALRTPAGHDAGAQRTRRTALSACDPPDRKRGKAAAIAACDLHALLTARVAADEYVVERLLRPALPAFRTLPGTQIQFLQLNHAGKPFRPCAAVARISPMSRLVARSWTGPVEIIVTLGVGLYASPSHPSCGLVAIGPQAEAAADHTDRRVRHGTGDEQIAAAGRAHELRIRRTHAIRRRRWRRWRRMALVCAT